jgi:hypothetical protein
MRKFSKILAILLALCVLGGVIAVTVLASYETEYSSEKTSLAVTSTGKWYDFESYDVGKDFGYNSNPINFKNGSGNAHLSSYADICVEADGVNQYLRYAWKANKTTSGTYRRDFVCGASGITAGDTANYYLSNFSYVVIDMDIAADMYRYTLDGVEDLSAEVPETYDKGSLRLAYSNNTYFELDNRAMNGKNGFNSLSVKLVYDDAAAVWRVHAGIGETTADSGYTLSNTLGEWNHFTYVIKVENSGEGTNSNYAYSPVYLFFNGNFVKEGDVYRTNQAAVAGSEIIVRGIDWQIPTLTKVTNDETTYYQEQYSMAIDNVAANYYGATYVDTVDYGIADFLAGEDYKKVNLSKCEDVLYNKNYVYPSVNGYVSIDGGTTKAYTPAGIDAILAGLEDEGEITATRSIAGFTPAEGVESFTVDMPLSCTFALADAVADNYIVERNELTGLYTVSVPTADQQVEMVWVDAKGNELGRETVNIYETPVGEYTLNDDYVYTITNAATGAYNYKGIDYLGGWKYIAYLDGEYLTDIEPIEFGALDDDTFSLFAELIAEGYEIRIVPNYNEVDVNETAEAFIVFTFDAQGNKVFVPEASGVDYDDMATFKAAMEAAVDGATFVLTYDKAIKYDLGGGTSITVPAGITVNLDLNGRTLTASKSNANYAYKRLFLMSEGTTFNLFSSQEGGRLYHAPKDARYEIYYGTGVFDANLINECTVNIGKYTDAAGVTYSGDNLEINTGTIFYASTTEDDDKFAVCNVDGGTYFSAFRPGYATFAIAGSDVEINLNNATFYQTNTNASYGFINNNYSKTLVSYDTSLNVSNSEIICVTADGKALTNFVADAEQNITIDIKIDNSTVVGKITSKKYYSGKVTLGENCILAGRFVNPDGKVIKIATADGTSLANANNGVVYSGNYEVPALTESMQAYAEGLQEADYGYVALAATADIAYATYDAAKELPEHLVKVQFNNVTGTAVVDESVWYVGSIPEFTGDVADVGEIEQLGNKWYNLGYNGWKNAASADNSAVAGSVNVYNPVKVPVPALSVKINFGIYTNFTANVYLPIYNEVDGVSILDGVTFVGVYANAELTGDKLTENWGNTGSASQKRVYRYINAGLDNLCDIYV